MTGVRLLPYHRDMPSRSCLRLLSACLCLLLLGACGEGPLVRQESYVFGTRVEVLTFGTPEPEAQAAISTVLREFDRLHRTLHAWQPSPLTELNTALARGEQLQVSAEMAGLLTVSQDFAQRSDGLFDPAIGGLIELWGFHSDTYVPRLPAPADLQTWLAAHPGMQDVHIEGLTVSSANRAVRIDLGGIAKGYALDRAATLLREAGIRNALINIGGNIMALGAKGKQHWSVGIQDPRGSGALASLALYDGEAIGTSGDYQRFFEVDGQRYSHLLDPRTARPATHTQAVTVLIPSRENAGLLSDVVSKPLFLAAGDWPAMARRLELRDVLRVDDTGHIQLTPDLRQRLRWTKDIPAATIIDPFSSASAPAS